MQEKNSVLEGALQEKERELEALRVALQQTQAAAAAAVSEPLAADPCGPDAVAPAAAAADGGVVDPCAEYNSVIQRMSEYIEAMGLRNVNPNGEFSEPS